MLFQHYFNFLDISRLKLAANSRRRIPLEDGWITPHNGFQYKNTPNFLGWEEARRICLSWGADLTVYGVREEGFRKYEA